MNNYYEKYDLVRDYSYKIITYDILYTISMTLLIIFYLLDGHNIMFNIISTKYNKFKKINQLISTRHKNMMVIFYVGFKMIVQSLYINLIQYINNNVKKINKNQTEITYVINGKMHKMIVTLVRGPLPILQVSDENHNDVTNDILLYYGPNHNWHNTEFTPKFFKNKELFFELSNGESILFSENQIINF